MSKLAGATFPVTVLFSTLFSQGGLVPRLSRSHPVPAVCRPWVRRNEAASRAVHGKQQRAEEHPATDGRRTKCKRNAMQNAKEKCTRQHRVAHDRRQMALHFSLPPRCFLQHRNFGAGLEKSCVAGVTTWHF